MNVKTELEKINISLSNCAYRAESLEQELSEVYAEIDALERQRESLIASDPCTQGTEIE